MPVCDLSAGDIVQDSEDDDPDDAVVVNTPPVAANDWEAPGLDGDTVADDNPDYPADAPVAIIVYRHHIEEYDPEWLADDDPDPIPVGQLREDGVLTYSFPAPRLTRVDGSPAEDTDAPDIESNDETDETTRSDGQSQTGAASTGSQTGDPAESAATSSPEEREAASESEPEQTSEPVTQAVQALKDRLEDGGMTVKVESDGETLRAEKLGEYYRVRPGAILEGDGALRNRLESIVTEFGDDAADVGETDVDARNAESGSRT